ncbi:MAG: hypothetical protein AAGE90_02200 [Pseudomonadota bacterium]
MADPPIEALRTPKGIRTCGHHRERPALILGARYPAVALVQALAPRGVACRVCAPLPLQAAWSRYARYSRMPSCGDTDAALARLEDIVARGAGRPVIFPAGDAEARLLAKARDRLSRVADCSVSSADTVTTLLDKGLFYARAAKLGLSCPTALPLDPSSRIAPLPFPFVVKPRNYTDLLSQGSPNRARPTGFKFARIENDRGWSDFLRVQDGNLASFIAQSLVPGGTDDRYALSIFATRETGLVRAFAARVLRSWPDGYGNTILAENAVVPDALLDEVAHAVRGFALEGIAEFEYRRDAATGAFSLIEINPRVSTWTQLARLGPADPIWAAYAHACGTDVSPGVVNAEPGRLKIVRALSDLTNAWTRLPKGHPARRIGPTRWRRSVAAESTHIVETDRRDWTLAFGCAGLQVVDMLRGQ